MKRLLILLIKIYQKTLSPDHGWFKAYHPYGFCPFQPTCSQYCLSALQKYNIFIAIIKCAWRLIRCHPWSKGGYDQA